MTNFERKIRQNIECCACHVPMCESEHINFASLPKLATWKHPVAGNALAEDKWPRAIAVLCDKCIEKNSKPKFAVEFRKDAADVIYHDIYTLDDLSPLFPEPSVNVYGDLICPKCKINIITPAGATVMAGIGHCPMCHIAFEVSEKQTKLANEISNNFKTLSGQSNAR